MSADSDPAQPTAVDVVQVAARAYERDRYLSALLAPAHIRGDLIALAAFAGEVGRVPAFVSEPMMGRIRLQWWRERIEAGTSSGHPIATAALAAIERHNLPKSRFIDLIDAHDDTLDDAPFADDGALHSYLLRTHGTLFVCEGLIRGFTIEPTLARHAALAYGLSRHLLELFATISHGRQFLPMDRLANAGLSAERVQSDERKTLIMEQVAADVAKDAHRFLVAVRLSARTLSRAQRRGFLPLALVEPYLRLFEQQGLRQNGLGQAAAADIGSLSRVIRLWFAHATARL